MNGLDLLSATDQGEHDDHHHHHPQAQHPGVDIGGGGGDGDGDGCQDQEAQHDHPEYIRPPESVGSVEPEELSCHPAMTKYQIEVKARASALPFRENFGQNIQSQDNFISKGLSALRNDELQVSFKPLTCYEVINCCESHID